MDADETLSRLFQQRRYLIVIAVLIGAAVFGIVRHDARATYRADTRLLLGPELNSVQEAQTVVSRARAIATSTNVVTMAIRQAKAAGTVSSVRSEIGVSGVSDSGLATLSVTDADPGVAAALCRALGHATTDFINTTNFQSIQSTLNSIQTQLQQAVAQYTSAQAGATGPSAAAQLALISENITSLSTARGQLLARQAQAVAAKVVDEPPALGVRTASNVVAVAGLSVVAALLLWLLTAVLVEALRPTFPVLRSVGRSFDAPVLGRLAADLALDDAETAETLDRIVLSAQHLRVETLVVGGHRTATPRFVSGLDEFLTARGRSMQKLLREQVLSFKEAAVPAAVGAPRGAGAETGGTALLPVQPSTNGRATKARPMPHRAIATDLAHLAPPTSAGVLVVTHAGAPRSELRVIEELVRCTYWPVVGIVQVKIPRRRVPGIVQVKIARRPRRTDA
jgi:capsular polysaccharide biosynthesis protein